MKQDDFIFFYQAANHKIHANPALVAELKAQAATGIAADSILKRPAGYRRFLPAALSAAAAVVCLCFFLGRNLSGSLIHSGSDTNGAPSQTNTGNFVQNQSQNPSENMTGGDQTVDMSGAGGMIGGGTASSASSGGQKGNGTAEKPDGTKPGSSSGSQSFLAKPLAAVKYPSTQGSEHALGAAFTDSYQSFSARTAALLASEKGNAVYSPASLYLTLSMLSEITAGNTKTELLSALGTTDSASLRSWNSKFYQNNFFSTQTGSLKMANSIWVQEGYPVKMPAVNLLAGSYYTETYRAPFGQDKAAKTIAGWLSKNTGGRLGDTLSAAKNPDTAFILLNTVSFGGLWIDPFDPKQNQKAPFTRKDGSQISAEYMTSDVHREVLLSADYQAVDLELANHCKLRLALPTGGRSPEQLLAGNTLSGLLSSQGTVAAKLDLAVPKFSFQTTLDLKSALPKLGIKALINAPDFSPITNDQLDFTEAKQRVFFSVDERGCEAAAYTEAGPTCGEKLPAEKLTLRFDRPFVFVLFCKDQPFFIGTVNQPAV